MSQINLKFKEYEAVINFEEDLHFKDEEFIKTALYSLFLDMRIEFREYKIKLMTETPVLFKNGVVIR